MAVAVVKRPPLWRVLDKSQYTHSPPGPKKVVEVRLCKHEFSAVLCRQDEFNTKAG